MARRTIDEVTNSRLAAMTSDERAVTLQKVAAALDLRITIEMSAAR